MSSIYKSDRMMNKKGWGMQHLLIHILCAFQVWGALPFGARALSRRLTALIVLALGRLPENLKSFEYKTKMIVLYFFMIMIASLVSAQPKSVKIDIGGAQLVKFEEGVSEVFIVNPEVADVQLINKHTAYIFGKSYGATQFYAFNKKGVEILKANVMVSINLTQLRELIAPYDPHELVEIKPIPNGVLLEGVVDTPKVAEDIRSLADKFVGKDKTVLNRMTIKAPVQVNLRVKVAEVQRNVVNELGFNWQAVFSNVGNFNFGTLIGRAPFTALPIATNNVTSITQPLGNATTPFIDTVGFNFQNSHVNLNLAIDALAQEGLITILAEPNLVCVSGETASFLAGGEFPYPVPQQLGNITIDFKSFGVSLDFTPTVLDGNVISMRVRPEVSELDNQLGIFVNGTAVPGILTRRAETTIQLGSGQTFAIAGLLQNSIDSQIASLPGLGDLPVLGALFRSNSFQRGDTELVILVTPFIVEPASGKEMLLPTDGIKYATFVEQIFERRLIKPGIHMGQAPDFGPGGVRLVGPAGFSLE